MKITEEKLNHFANFVGQYATKKEAFKHFQQKENQHIFSDIKKNFSKEKRDIS